MISQAVLHAVFSVGQNDKIFLPSVCLRAVREEAVHGALVAQSDWWRLFMESWWLILIGRGCSWRAGGSV